MLILKLKKQLIVLLVLLQCFCNLASVVTDNDGATFISKVELDSLKNDFESKLNNYYVSIDSKIDNAIAEYLSALNIVTEDKLISRYPNPNGSIENVKWTSNTTYSYDNVGDKYWSFFAEFEQVHNRHWSQFRYSYGNDREYVTLYKNTNGTYGTKKMKFELRGFLTFSRLRGQNSSTTAGRILWGSNFWPTTLREGQKYEARAMDAGLPSNFGWCYTCVQYPVVMVNDVTLTTWILAPKSDATTYTYVPNKELKGDNGSSYDDRSNYTRIANYANSTSIDCFVVYRNMKVKQSNNESDDASIIGKKTKDLTLEWVAEYDTNKQPIKNGVLLCKSTRDGNVTVDIKCSASGKIILSKTKDFISWDEKEYSVGNIDTETLNYNNIKKNEYIYIKYLPTSTTEYGYISKIDIKIKG